MKLEPNMYVRLVNDVEDIVVINKIANVFETTILTENDGSIYQGEYTKENVVKASYDIIDLIEVGDYVNGYKVVKIDDLSCYDNRIGSKYIEIDFNVENDYEHWCEDTVLQNPNIKSIVTKEQFESMKYSLEG